MTADLQELLARVEKAEGPDRALDHELFIDLEWTGQGDHRTPPAYTASLDAALALVERVLPGWTKRADLHPAGAIFSVEPEFKPGVWRATPAFQATAKTPALALLAALLRALISNSEEGAG